MNKQIEMLKTKLNDKVAEIDRRLKRCEKDVLIDHSEHRERLHSQARGYERVLKMIEELPDPIPLPTIKTEDKARIAFEQIKERIDEAINDGDAMGWKYSLNDINNIVMGWEDELE